MYVVSSLDPLVVYHFIFVPLPLTARPIYTSSIKTARILSFMVVYPYLLDHLVSIISSYY